MVAIIDTADDTTRALPALVADGVTGIIRYDSRTGHWKEASNTEIAQLIGSGIAVGIVNEGVGDQVSAFTEESGYLDASYSLARARRRGQAAESAVYYAVDFDPSSAAIESNIVPYFLGVQKAHRENVRHWRVGVYGSGLCSLELKTRSLVDFTWITCS